MEKEESLFTGPRKLCKACKSDENKKYRELNKEYYSTWAKSNRTRMNESATKWRKENPEKVKESKLRYVENNYEKVKADNRIYSKKRKSKIGGRLHARMSRLIYSSLKYGKDGKSWVDLVGYGPEDLKIHLEKQFKNGMGWHNIGEWHIDHIIPRRAFNFEKPEDIDFKRCWSLKNLQPLWATENIKKGGKLKTPFQPSLIM